MKKAPVRGPLVGSARALGAASPPKRIFGFDFSRDARKKPGGFPQRKPVYPACAPIKKPIPGQPEIGAHFVSFNFPNNLICAIASRIL